MPSAVRLIVLSGAGFNVGQVPDLPAKSPSDAGAGREPAPRLLSSKSMRLRAILGLFGAILGAYQMPFREYPGQEYSNFPLPSDYKQPAEFVFARLMYPDGGGAGGFGGFRRGRF